MATRSLPRTRLLVGVALFIVALAVLLHTPFTRSYARQRLIAWLAGQGIDARIDDFRYTLFGLRATMTGVRLAARHSPDTPFFETDRIEGNVPWSVIRGPFEVDTASLGRATVRLVRGKDGRWNLPEADVPGPEREFSGLPLSSLSVNHLRLDIDDANAAFKLSIPDATIALRPDGINTSAGLISAQGLSTMVLGDRHFVFRSLSGRARYDGTNVDLDGLRVEVLVGAASQEAPVTRQASTLAAGGPAAGELGTVIASGRIASIYRSPTLNLKVEGTARLDAVPRLVELPAAPAGEIKWNGTVTGPAGEPVVTLDAVGESVKYGPVADIGLKTRATIDAKAFVLDNVEGEIAGGHLKGTARLPFEHGVEGTLSATWNDLRLSSVLSSALTSPPPSVEARLAGKADLKWVDGTWRRLSGQLTNDATAMPGAARTTLAGRSTFRAADGAWTLDHNHVVDGAIRLEGRSTGRLDETALGRASLGGRLNASTGDVQAALVRYAGIAPSGFAKTLHGAATASVALSGTIEAPRYQGRLDVRGLQAGTLSGGTLTANLAGDLNRLTLTGMDARLASAHATGKADIRFSPFVTDVTSTMDIADVGDVRALAEVSDVWLTSGSAHAEGTAHVTGGTTTVQATVTARDLETAGQTIAEVRGPVAFDGSHVSSPGLTIVQAEPRPDPVVAANAQGSSTAGTIDVAGSYDIRRGIFDATARGRDLHVQPIPAGAITTGPLDVSGRIAALDVDVDGTLADLRGTAAVVLADGRWTDFPIGAASAKATISDGQARTAVEWPAGGTSGEITVGLTSPWAFTANLHAALDDVESLLPDTWVEPESARGMVALEGQASGTFADLDNVKADLRLTRLEITANGAPVRLQKPGRITIDGNRVGFEDVAIDVNGLAVAGTGAFGVAGAGTLDLTVRGDLAGLGPIVAIATPDGKIRLSGTLDAHVRAAGTRERPMFDGNVSIASATVTMNDWPAIQDVNFNASLANGLLSIDTLHAAWLEATLDATGSSPLRALSPWLPGWVIDAQPVTNAPASLSAKFDNVTRAVIAPFTGPDALEDIAGEISGTLTLEAPQITLDELTGELVLDQVDIAFSQVPVAQVAPTRLTLAKRTLTVDNWRWTGAGSEFEVTGGARIDGNNQLRLDAAVDTTVDLKLLSAFSRAISTGGQAMVSLTLSGPAADPNIDGSISINDAALRVRDPRIAVANVNASALVTRGELRIDRFEGSANGGQIFGGGVIDFDGVRLSVVDLWAWSQGLALEYPRGLRTEVEATLTMKKTTADRQATIAGVVTFQRGAYRQPITLLGLAQSFGGSTETPVDEPSAFGRTAYNIRVLTGEDLIFDNNLGRFQAGGDVRLIGTVARPGMSGRLAFVEGGELYLSGNTYRIERAAIDFVSPNRIRPVLGVSARTRVSGVDITLDLSGSPDQLRVTLSSETRPELGQGDLASLLVTGRTLSEASASQEAVAREQVIGLLSGEILSFAGRAVGVDSVRVDRGFNDDDLLFDPSLIAGEANPAARLTVSKRLGPEVEVIYSQNLREGDEFTWVISYKPRRLFELRFVERDTTARSYEFRQDLSFGGARQRATRKRPEQPRIVSVRIEGLEPAAQADVLRRLKLKEGKKFDFFKWQDDRDRVLESFHDRSFYEARVDVSRHNVTGEDGLLAGVELSYRISSGPRSVLKVEGTPLSSSLKKAMTEEWTRSVFDGFLVDDLSNIARRALLRQGHPLAKATADIQLLADGRVKEATVLVEPGAQVTARQIEWQGNDNLPEISLRDSLRAANLTDEVWIDPGAAEAPIERTYSHSGFLEARLTAGEPRQVGDAAVLTLSIVEGPKYLVDAVSLNGVHALERESVEKVVDVEPGNAYDPASLENLRDRLEQRYRRSGFNDVQTDASASVDRERQRVKIDVSIEEGPQQILSSVNIDGLNKTKASVVERAMNLKAGTPVNEVQWLQARRRLYDEGLFRQADIEPVPAGPAQPDPATGLLRQPVDAKVSIEELPLYRLRYGVELADEPQLDGSGRDLGPGVVVELRRNILFGRAISAGIAGRYENNFQVGRIFLSSRRFFNLPLLSSVFVTRSRETFREPGFVPFANDRTLIGAEQRWRPRRRNVEFLYSYSFERSRVFGLESDPLAPIPLDVYVNVSKLSSGLIFDHRNDVLDASKGWFHSSNVEYASTLLGSDLRFIRYLSQLFYYKSLGTRGVVLASAARVGLADGFGQELIVSERFFAGGANSVRGYRNDSLGPQLNGIAVGGEGLLIFNQEFRFPIYKWFRGVAFVDAGNVYADPSSIDFDLEVGAGAGLRLATPVGLIRLDLGYPMSGTGNKTARWYFSIGQAF